MTPSIYVALGTPLIFKVLERRKGSSLSIGECGDKSPHSKGATPHNWAASCYPGLQSVLRDLRVLRGAIAEEVRWCGRMVEIEGLTSLRTRVFKNRDDALLWLRTSRSRGAAPAGAHASVVEAVAGWCGVMGLGRGVGGCEGNKCHRRKGRWHFYFMGTRLA